MLVLGLIDSKPSSAAILSDGQILAAVAEERLCRKKMATGVPLAAIEEVLRLAGVGPADLDRVAVAQRVSVYEPSPRAWLGWFESEQQARASLFDRVGSALAPVAGQLPVAWKAHHAIKRVVFRERLRKLPQLLEESFGIAAPIRFHDHHHCHATSACFTSGMERALVVTLDGGGDGLSGSVSLASDGHVQRVAAVDSFNSLGNLYSYVTVLCGFKAERHEGKITGLAAYGTPRYADVLREVVRYEEPGRIRYRVPMYHRSALRGLRERLPEDFDRADLAASVQLVLEEVGLAFVRHWARATGLRQIALAGGVFANVKLNQRIHELDEVDSVFVHPAMDDGGLSVGSALATLADEGSVSPDKLVRRLEHVYLGPSFDDARIEQAIQATGFAAERPTDVREAIAALLADGRVVARFTGGLEYGPRALGHRSILYRTTDPSVNDWLNARLQRTEFMPFGPATLVEHAADCYRNLEGAEDTARFMTITFDCTPEMRERSPGVVHVDGTARPQLVDAETSPDLHGILEAYQRRTGLPSVINTSFNMHEEPIVCTPEDALRAFRDGRLDYLAIGDWLVRHPDAAPA
jgi:carbamoyltransferase